MATVVVMAIGMDNYQWSPAEDEAPGLAKVIPGPAQITNGLAFAWLPAKSSRDSSEAKR